MNGAVNRRLFHAPQNVAVYGLLRFRNFIQRLVRGDGLSSFRAGVGFAQFARHPNEFQRGIGHVHHRLWVRRCQQSLLLVRRRLLLLCKRLQLRRRIHHQIQEHVDRAQRGWQVLVAANAPGAPHHLLNAHRVPVRLQNVHVPHVAQIDALRPRRRNHQRVDDLAVEVVAGDAQQLVPNVGRHLVPLAVENAANNLLLFGGFGARVQRKPALARVFGSVVQNPLVRRLVVLDAELRVVVRLHRHFQQPNALQRAELAVHQVEPLVLRVLQVLQQFEELRAVNGQCTRVEVLFLVAFQLVQHLLDAVFILLVSLCGGFFLQFRRFVHAERAFRVLGNSARIVGIDDVFINVFVHVFCCACTFCCACAFCCCAYKRFRAPEFPGKHEVARRAREDAVRAGRLGIQFLHGHRFLSYGASCAFGPRFAPRGQHLALVRLAVLVDFHQPLLLIHAQLVIAHRHPHHLEIVCDIVAGQQLLLGAAVIRRQAEDAPFEHVHVFQIRRVGIDEILFKPVKRVGQRLVRHGIRRRFGGLDALGCERGRDQFDEVLVAHAAVIVHVECDAVVQLVQLRFDGAFCKHLLHIHEPVGVARHSQHLVGRAVFHVVHDVHGFEQLLQPGLGDALRR